MKDLERIAQKIVREAHSRVGGQSDTPMGRGAGGKADDTTLVVSAIIPMHSEDARALWGPMPSFRSTRIAEEGGLCGPCRNDAEDESDDGDDEEEYEDDHDFNMKKKSEGS